MHYHAFRRLIPAAAIVCVVASACHRSRHHGATTLRITGICPLLADGSRQQLYAGDPTTGHVVAVSTTNGQPVRSSVAGNAVAGMALDRCYDQLFAALPDEQGIAVLDLRSFRRIARLGLGAPTYALASGWEDHVIAVTTRGLLDVGVDDFTTRTLQADVDPHAIVCSDRRGSRAWLIQSVDDAIAVSRFELSTDAPPATSVPSSLQGRSIGACASFDADRVYVGTDGEDGIYVLDGETLAKLGSIGVGPDLVSLAVNATGTRMYVSRGGGLVESLNLDTYARGRDLFAASDVTERGLIVAPNNQSLFVTGSDESLSAYPLFDVRIDMPTVLRIGQCGALTLDGTPLAPWFMFANSMPGYLYVDAPQSEDPRFFDLACDTGFVLLFSGRFDAAGHAEIPFHITPDYAAPSEVVLQAAELPRRGRANLRISNPLAVQILARTCR